MNTFTEQAKPGSTLDITPTVRAREHNSESHETEDFLEPLVFDWDEDKFEAAEAIRAFCAEMYADH